MFKDVTHITEILLNIPTGIFHTPCPSTNTKDKCVAVKAATCVDESSEVVQREDWMCVVTDERAIERATREKTSFKEQIDEILQKKIENGELQKKGLRTDDCNV